MGGTTTTYRVEAVYDLTDKASKQLEEIAKHAKAAHHATAGLKDTLLHLAEGFALAEGVRKGKEALIGFNQQVQDSHIALTAMIQSNTTATFDQADKAAERMYAHWQKFSMKTPVTTAQIMQFGQGIATAAFQAGASDQQITKMAEMGVIAGKVLGGGHDTGYITSELSHLLSGNVNSRMLFAKNLLGTMGLTEEQWKKQVKPEDRVGMIMKALEAKPFQDAANAFGDSFTGVLSTLEDKVQIFLGKVGLPLFKAITKEIASWNEWLTRNEAVLDVYVNRAGQVLKDAFGTVRDAFAFIAEHSGTLIKVAEAYIAIKIAGGIGSSITGMAGGIGSAFSGKASIAGNAGFLAEIGVGAYMATRALMDLSGATEATKRAIDPHAAMLDVVTKRLDSFELAVAKSKDSLMATFGEFDSRSTGKYATIQPYYEQEMQKAEALRKAAGIDERLRNSDNPFGDDVQAGLEKAGFTSNDATKYRGYTGDDLNKAADQIEAAASSKRDEYRIAANTTNALLKIEMAQMTQAQRDGVNWAKVQTQILEAILRGDKLDVKKTIADTTEKDLKGKMAVHQNVNVYINQVSAKDPDRWLAEMDDMAAKRANAPTRAKSALARGF